MTVIPWPGCVVVFLNGNLNNVISRDVKTDLNLQRLKIDVVRSKTWRRSGSLLFYKGKFAIHGGARKVNILCNSQICAVPACDGCI